MSIKWKHLEHLLNWKYVYVLALWIAIDEVNYIKTLKTVILNSSSWLDSSFWRQIYFYLNATNQPTFMISYFHENYKRNNYSEPIIILYGLLWQFFYLNVKTKSNVVIRLFFHCIKHIVGLDFRSNSTIWLILEIIFQTKCLVWLAYELLWF